MSTIFCCGTKLTSVQNYTITLFKKNLDSNILVGVGDLLIWDNCAAQHKARFDNRFPLRRLMFRITVRGSITY